VQALPHIWSIGSELRTTCLPGTRVNKGKGKGRVPDKDPAPYLPCPRCRGSLASVPFGPRDSLTRFYGNVTYFPRKSRADLVSRRRVTLVELHHPSPVIVVLAMVGTLFGS
jgi:hypothetical protein